jgi:hypothetical protein
MYNKFKPIRQDEKSLKDFEESDHGMRYNEHHITLKLNAILSTAPTSIPLPFITSRITV